MTPQVVQRDLPKRVVPTRVHHYTKKQKRNKTRRWRWWALRKEELRSRCAPRHPLRSLTSTERSTACRRLRRLQPAQIERDFSHCGLFCVPNRSRVEEYWLEMVIFLKANFRSIPAYEDIPNIDSRDIRKCLPAKFRGTNEDLLKAEMALDPPSEADIGVGEDG